MWAFLISLRLAAAVEGLSLDQWGMPLLFGDQLLECPNNQHDGRYIRTTGTTKIKGYCESGVAVGTWSATSEDGFNWKGTLDNGRFVGTFKSWYPNGERRAKGKYEAGKRIGTWKYWHDNGSLSGQGVWTDGKESGCWEAYYKNGERAWAGAYVDGEKVGRWLNWTAGGKEKQVYGGEPTQGACWWILW